MLFYELSSSLQLLEAQKADFGGEPHAPPSGFQIECIYRELGFSRCLLRLLHTLSLRRQHMHTSNATPFSEARINLKCDRRAVRVLPGC